MAASPDRLRQKLEKAGNNYLIWHSAKGLVEMAIQDMIVKKLVSGKRNYFN